MIRVYTVVVRTKDDPKSEEQVEYVEELLRALGQGTNDDVSVTIPRRRRKSSAAGENDEPSED